MPRSVLVLSFLLLGCAAPAEEPSIVSVAPELAPPPVDGERRLTRKAVLAMAQGKGDPEEIVARLDQQPFDFDLDAAALHWFGQQGIPPDVLDYLRKRSRIDWEAQRGDIPPPPARK